MYPSNEKKPCPMNARDFVDLLDELCKLRAQQVVFVCDTRFDEQCEIIKRQLTDYLLDIDKRPGIYVRGDNDRLHSHPGGKPTLKLPKTEQG